MTNDRFAATTRSASFALTLSDPQIQYLLGWVRTTELEAEHPRYAEMGTLHFGTADDLAVMLCTPTVRALARKGLVDVHPTEPPVRQTQVVRLTPAGLLVAQLLAEAGFEVDPRSVRPAPLHLDPMEQLA